MGNNKNILKVKGWFFEKVTKISQSLARLIKKRNNENMDFQHHKGKGEIITSLRTLKVYYRNIINNLSTNSTTWWNEQISWKIQLTKTRSTRRIRKS